MQHVLIRFLTLIVIWPGFALAGNTGAVFGPVVHEGHESWQLRSGFDVDTDALVNRIHYQRAISGDVQWRLIAQARKTDHETLDFDLIQGEITWQLSPDTARYKQGLRFDLLVREQLDRHQFSINWMHTVAINERLSSGFLMMFQRQFGADRNDGVFFQTRANLAFKASNRWTVALEMYNNYGSSSERKNFEAQNHQIGPMATYQFGNGWSVHAGTLFGVNSATSDQHYRLWLGKRL